MPTYQVEIIVRNPTYNIEADNKRDAIRLAEIKFSEESIDCIAEVEIYEATEKLEEDWN